MPLDARIPLSGSQVSFSQPLVQLGLTQRQDRLDKSALQTAEQNRRINSQTETLNSQRLTQGQRELDANEMQAAILNIGGMQQALLSGDTQTAAKLGISVQKTLSEAGQDTSKFENIIMAMEDNPSAVLDWANQAVPALNQQAVALRARAGQQAPKPEVLSNAQVSDSGQYYERTDSGVSARDVSGFRAAPPAPEADAGNQIVQITLGNGNKITGSFDPKTLKVYDQSGSELNDPGMRFSGSTITGANDEVIAPSIVANLNNSKQFTQTLVNNLTDMKEILKADPNSGTLAGTVSSFVANIKADAMALSEAVGVEFDESLFDVSAHEDEFKRLGLDSAVLKSIATGAAYSLAASQNDGRVSGPDFDAALLQIGANLSDPTARIAVIDSIIARETRSFRQNYRNVMGEEFSGDFGVSVGGQTGALDVKSLSDEELFN